MASKYTVARQFSEGFCAALLPEPIDDTKGPDWMAGYEAGYGLREEKNRLMNEHLLRTGHEPMGTIRIQ